jgi:RNA polymerase sigma-70 factor (ECF subfamily)
MLNQQEQEQFVCLWTDVQLAVDHYIHALVRDPAAARDLVQETALVLLRRFPEYDRSRPFLNWALGVAKFQVLGFQRDSAGSFVTFDTDLLDKFTEVWEELSPAAAVQSSALEVCVDRLPSRSRQLVRLRYVEELDASTIGQRLGVNSSAVRVSLQRIREQLRDCIERRLKTEGGSL